MSLSACLLKHKDLLKDFDTSDVKEIAAKYVSDGMAQQDAERKAVGDKLRELRAEKARIEADVKEKYRALDPEGYNELFPPAQQQPAQEAPALELSTQTREELNASQSKAAEQERQRLEEKRIADLEAEQPLQLQNEDKRAESDTQKKIAAQASIFDQPSSGPIADIGEKIGGARKDTAVKTGRSTKAAKTDDDRPTWLKRYDVAEVVSGQQAGRWTVRDNRDNGPFSRPVGGWSNTYASEQEARDAIPLLAVKQKHGVYKSGEVYGIWRNINDRKRVKVVDKEFATREEAYAYMAANAAEIIETNTTFGEADLPKPDNTRRIGEARRDGDVVGQAFKDVFGFRGVEFGNWNNQAERQEVMNAAYDGLLDLAEALEIPPKAIGLNGDLALAFGARGQGLSSARAHYERNKAVINLTKMNGAGALAHEWFHALDHYLGRQDGKASSVWKIDEDGTRSFKVRDRENDYASYGFLGKSGVRAEVREAYKNVIETIFTKAETYVEDTQKADQFVGKTREMVAENLDALRKELSEQKDVRYYKRNNKPASAEQLAAFDEVAKKIMDGEALETEYRLIEGKTNKVGRLAMPGGRWTNDALEAIGGIYKSVRGRSGFGTGNQRGVLDGLKTSMNLYSSRLKMLAEAQSGEEKVKRVPTSFAMDAKSLDQGRGENYWTTPHEMAARAFQGYVEDKIGENGNQSPFLNYAPENKGIITPWGVSRPYPAGEERKAINAAFEKFVGILESKETETGTALFSRDIPESDKADRRMNAMIDEFEKGTLKDTDSALLGETPGVLQRLGAPKLPIQISGAVINKVLKGKHSFTMTPDLLRQIPAQLYEPLMVFDSATEPGSKVVLTELVNKIGEAIVVPIHLEVTTGRITVNEIASVYGRTNAQQKLENWAKDGLLRYYDKDKALAPSTTVRLQLPYVVQLGTSANSRVISSDDIVKFARGSQAQSLDPTDAKAAVDVIASKWKNAPKINVWESFDQAPAALRDEIERADAQDARGAWHGGEIHLFPQNIPNLAVLERTLVHESRHAGLDGVFGRDLNPVLMNLYLKNAELRKEVNALQKKTGLNTVNQINEVLADKPLDYAQKLSGWKQVVGKMKDWFEKNGFTRLAAMLDGPTADELVKDVLYQAEEFIRSGKKSTTLTGGAMFSMGDNAADATSQTDTPAFREFVRQFVANQPIDKYTYNRELKELKAEIINDWSSGNTNRETGSFGPDEILATLRKENAAKYFDEDGDYTNAGNDRYTELEDALAEKYAKQAIGEPQQQTVDLTDPSDAAEVLREYFDANGLEPNMVGGSGKSRSKYFTLGDGTEIRVSDHELPDQYDQRANENIILPDDADKAMDVLAEVAERYVRNATPANSADQDRSASQGEMQERSVRAETSGPKEPAQLNAGGGKVDITKNPAFRKWFGSSKVVNPDGTPMAVYHGTKKDFNTFDPEMVGSNFGFDKKGFFFTNKPTKAGGFATPWGGDATGGNIMPAYVSLKNPLTLDYYTWMFDTNPKVEIDNEGISLIDYFDDNRASIIYEAEKQGFDGVLFERDGEKLVVAFRPTQIKSAVGNNGDFDSNNPNILFSRGGNRKQQKAVEAAAEYGASKSIRMIVGKKMLGDVLKNPNKFNAINRTLNTQLHKAIKNKEFGKVFWATQMFVEDVSQFAAQAAELSPELLPNYADIRNIKQVIKDSVNPVKAKKREADIKAAGAAIFDGTMLGGGNPLDGKVWTDAELKERGLTEQGVKFYRDARKIIDKSLDDLAMSEVVRMIGERVDLAPEALEILKAGSTQFRDGLLDAISTAVDQSEGARKEQMQDILDRATETFKHADALKDAGYAPLMRFGKYFVTAVDKETGETLYRAHYENRIDLNLALSDVRAKFKNADVSTGTVSDEDFKLMRGMTPETIMLFAEKVGLPMDMREAAQTYYREAVSQRSAMKRRIERQGTSGFSDDLTRALAGFVTSNARRAATNYNLSKIMRAVDEIQKADGDVRDEALKMVEAVENPTEDAAALRGVMYAYFIGGSLASAFVNLTQVPMMTLPMLSKYGTAEAASAVMAAMKSNSKLSPELRKALHTADEKGITDPQEVYYLYQETIRGISSNKNFQKAMGLWGSMFSVAENINRRTTFLAAYQMWDSATPEMRAKMKADTDATDGFSFAKRVVQETQGIYNKCVDIDTEILTASGWKNVNQLKLGEAVYSVDANGALVEDVLQEIHRYEGRQKVIERRNSNGLSIVTTPEHDNLVQQYGSRGKKWQKIHKVKTRDLKAHHHLLRAPLSDKLDRKAFYSDDEVRLFAWVASEGHLFAHRGCTEKRGVGLVQSSRHNAQYVAEIDSLLDRLGGHYNRKTSRGGEMVCWQLRKPLWVKIHEALPGKMLSHELVTKLTVPQMAIFVETFTKADGHFPKVGGELITQKDIGNLNVLQAMSVLVGRSSTMYERMGDHEFGALYVAKTSVRAHVKAMTAKEMWVDMVWCPQTKNGTWIARRNGRTFVTGNSNRPNLARGPIGATVFTFKQYSIAYLELVSRLPMQQKIMMLAMLWLVAGMGGLPFEEDAEDLIDTIGQAMGYNTNSKLFINEKVNQLLGETFGGLFVRGISGIPGSPIDIAGRMGMGNLLPGTSLFQRSEEGARARDVAEAVGPIGSMVSNAMNAWEALQAGEFTDALANAAPVAIGNAIKGIKWAKDEQATDYKDRLTVDGITLTEGLFKAIGFNPRKVADEGRVSRMVGQDVRLLRDVESDIVKKMAEAMVKGDSKGYEDAITEYESWNEKNPNTPIKITTEQVRRRAKEMQTERSVRQLKTIPKEARGAYAEMLRP
jgi:hypothetical protein